MRAIINILLVLWQFPQFIVGKMLLLFYRKKITYSFDTDDYSKCYFIKDFNGGISLSPTIIINSNYPALSKTVNHEYGHILQSRYLGPLYLIVIGLPSLIWAGLYGTLIKRSHNGYYRFYTEKWADYLGGVKRD